MSPATFALLSGALTYGSVLTFAAYQIWVTRRSPPDDDRRRPDAPRAPKPLPDCLQPRTLLSPKRIRELQDA